MAFHFNFQWMLLFGLLSTLALELYRFFILFDSQKLLMNAMSQFGVLSAIQNSVKACGSVPENNFVQQLVYHQCLVNWLEENQRSFSLPVYFQEFIVMGILVLTVAICIWNIASQFYYAADSDSSSTMTQFARKEAGHEDKQTTWHLPLLRTPMPFQHELTPEPHIPVLRTPLPQRFTTHYNIFTTHHTSSQPTNTLSPPTTHLHNPTTTTPHHTSSQPTNKNNNPPPHIFTTHQPEQPPPTTHLHNPPHIFTTHQPEQQPPTTHLHNPPTRTTTTHHTSSQPTNKNNNHPPHIFTTHQ
ncbi:hypothetical protein Pcinc_032452 [Petrolisthes cinctipes]|uniref:Uncharacterized protein n=1 Tax=Petrolisthes cinctipes TaxID=88211 RepID=A0AAE1EUA5_PETCI|nr:hypothetical protein Pcinc_032452 [Petrolisthes cinctipes]